MRNAILEKTVLLEKLEKSNLMLSTILEDYQENSLFTKDNFKKLNDAFSINQEYKNRLEKDDLEIAIIGVEKAGKSTFANALIKSTFLPSATERCTFTSTTIEYGEHEEAIIELYSEEEFNIIFNKLLKSINYPINKIPSDFRNLSLEEFEAECELLDRDNINYIPVHEDIVSILKDKNRFSLTGETIILNKLTNPDFDKIVNQYITGEVLVDGKSTAKPRSAKSIKIKTSNLAELKNAIIYDVPGFDSPVSEHKNQAKSYLEKADVVIFVTDASKPSFTSSVYEILSYKGKNGIELKDKLFIFGNRKDKANTLEQAEYNDKELLNEITKFQLNPENLVTGSALRALKEYGLHNEEISGLDVSGNIDLFREKIIDFNQTKRLDFFTKRIEENHLFIKGILSGIIDANKGILDTSNDEELRYKLNKNVESTIHETLATVNKEIKREFNRIKTLTHEFSQSINNTNVLQPITLDYVEKLSSIKSITNETSIIQTNAKAREKKFDSILQDFSDSLEKLSKLKTDQIRNKILDSLVANLKHENVVIDANKIKSLLEEIMLPFKPEHLQHNQFNFLFDRYSRHVFDIFSSPLGGDDREKKFNNAKVDFLYLDYFYALNSNAKNYQMISLLLTQKEGGLYESILKRTNQIIDSFIDNYTHHNTVLQSAEKVKTGFNWIKNKLTKQEDKPLENNNSLESQKDSLVKMFFGENSIFDIDIHRYISQPKSASSLEDIVNEINTDMENIKKILCDAVSPAMGLEPVFLNSMEKKIIESQALLTSASAINHLTNAIIGDISSFKEKQNIKLAKLNRLKELIQVL